jgi:ribose transport system permease protein
MTSPRETSKSGLAVRQDQIVGLLSRYSFGFASALALALLAANLARTPNFGWTNQLASFAPLAIAAMASTPAIISGGGGFDLSISPLMALVNIVFVFELAPHGLGGAAGAVLVLVLGASIGMLNGILISVARVPPIVATLATYFILIGLNLELAPSPKNLDSTWLSHLAGTVGPIPGGVLTIAVPIVVWALLGRIPYRAMLYAVGSNDATAFASGVNVGLVRVIAYGLGGLFAGLGGLALTGLTSSATGTTSSAYTLVAIAAVALGGTSLWGGRGGLVGSTIGAACIYLLETLLSSFQVSSSWLEVVYGVALLGAIVFGGLVTRRKLVLA